jgi:exopolysaccharide biosynthesis polyprenyl glycosylphosphotransferase
VILVSKAAGLYDRDEHVLRKTTLDEAPALLRVATLYALVIYLGKDVLVTDGPVTYEQVIGLWGILFVSMLVCRAAARQIARTLTKPERCLVLGDASAASLVGNKVAKSHAVKAEMIGFVPLEPAEEGQGDPHRLGALDELDGIVREHRVDRVIIAPRSADSERLLGAIRLAKSLGVRVSVLPRLFEVVGSSVEFDDVDGVILLGVRSYGLTRSSQTLKRGLDLVGASIGLFVLAPLLAMITVAIRLNTPGPAFFRQPRVGRDDRHFEMLKFRTMVTGADEQKAELLARNEAEGLFKIADDPRMTPVGRFLRRTSLDELPQLVNVLKGDMSLVGPRPLVIEEDRRVEGWHRRRLALTPGMTGLWQILGPTRIPLHEMVKIDYLYGANWSLWLDIKILLRTVPHVLARRGL